MPLGSSPSSRGRTDRDFGIPATCRGADDLDELGIIAADSDRSSSLECLVAAPPHVAFHRPLPSVARPSHCLEAVWILRLIVTFPEQGTGAVPPRPPLPPQLLPDGVMITVELPVKLS